MKFAHRLTMLLLALTVSVSVGQRSAFADDKAPDRESNPQKYLLRYQFRPGETLRYNAVSTKLQEGIVQFGRKVDTTKLNQTRLFTVGSVTESGEAGVSMQFEHVRMEMKSDDKPSDVFDTNMNEADIPRKFLAAARNLKASTPTYTVRTDGSPVSSDGVQQIPDGGQATFMMPLPAAEIAVGDSWKVNIIVNVRLDKNVKRDITLLRTYRLKAVDSDIATIGFSTSVVSPVRDPKVKAQLLEAAPHGEMVFDVRNGRLLKKEIRFDRTVLGVLGPNTILAAKGTTVETLVVDDATVTSR